MTLKMALRCAVLAACVVGLVGCGDDDDDVEDRDEASVETLAGVDFCEFETYDFLEVQEVPGGDAGIPLDQLAQAQFLIESAVTEELQALGLDQASVLPDLFVNTYYQFNDELFIDETCGYVSGGGQLFYSCDWVTVEEYTFGTAVIDLVDRGENTTVLRGVIQGAATGNNSEGRIDRLVGKVFEAYEDEVSNCS